MFYKNKNGRIGETITWILATILIVLILLVSIFAASFLGGGKSVILTHSRDPVAARSLSSYLLTLDVGGSGENIFNKLKKEKDSEELNGPNGKLASQIFNELYEKDYYVIWFGVKELGIPQNDYFGSYSEIANWEIQMKRFCIPELIFLEKNKWIHLVLCS